MSTNNNNTEIKRKFLDATGVNTLWTNIKNAINNVKTELTDDFTNNKLYRGYNIIKHNITSGGTQAVALNYNTYNIINISGTSATTLQFTFGVENNSSEDANFTCEYVIELNSPVSITIGLPTNIKWENDEPFEYESGYRYIISFIKNYQNDNLKAVYGKYPN